MSNHKLEDFKVGDKVRICESSKYYGEEHQLPPGDVGKIVGVYPNTISPLDVGWCKHVNGYRPQDIVLAEKSLELTINGFTDKEQIKAFIEWYSGQGEQDAAYWLEENCDSANSLECKSYSLDEMEMIVEPV